MNIAKKIIELIVYNYCEEEDSIFYGELIVLKKYANLDDINEELIEKLIKMVNIINNDLTKMALIETIVEFSSFEYDGNEKLLDEYLNIISKRNTSIEDNINCINAFIYSGAETNIVVKKICMTVDKGLAIRLIAGINFHLEDFPQEVLNICKEADIEKKRKYRIGIISTFLLIVHPLCSKYEKSYCISSSYPSYLTAVSDWAWSSKENVRYIIESGIVTKKEAEYLVKLGELLEKNYYLEYNEAKTLYNEFFSGVSPIDAMFCLP